MERLVCIELPDIAMQLLLKRRPQWSDDPVVLVEHDRPQALILEVNAHARHKRILPGMRLSDARGFDAAVHAATLQPREVTLSVEALARRLERFSPLVEQAAHLPGVFWLHARGLKGLWSSVNDWVQEIEDDLRCCGFQIALSSGFTRFGTLAACRLRSDTPPLFRTVEQERDAIAELRLDALHIEPQLRDELARLGIYRIRELRKLSVSSVALRFGEQAAALVSMVRGQRELEAACQQTLETPRRTLHFDDPVYASTVLLFRARRVIEAMLATLYHEGRGAAALELTLVFDWPRRPPEALQKRAAAAGLRCGESLSWSLRTARPTLQADVLIDLMRLRLEQLQIPVGITAMRLMLEPAPLESEQDDVLQQRAQHTLRAAHEVVARLRAELGKDAVGILEVRDGHLPEARQGWDVDTALRLPQMIGEVPAPQLVRAFFDDALELPPKERLLRDDGWLIRGLASGPVERLLGPYLIAGGWWHREVERDYHYAQTRRGDLLWVYYDRRRRRWYQQGEVS